MKNETLHILYKVARYTVIALAVGFFAAVLFGCKTRVIEVPVERWRTVHDTTRIVICEYDSIAVQDSVAWEHYRDSVDKYYEMHREIRLRFVHDTVDRKVMVHDSIEVPVRVEVPAELSVKEKVYLAAGRWLLPLFLILLIAAALAVAWRLWRR